MQTVKSKSLGSPDEVIKFAHGKAEIVTVEESTVARVTAEPGWKWSNDVRPLARTHRCCVRHLAYIVSGRLAVEMEDGTKVELAAGDYAVIPPGHDSWVVGGEPCVFVDFAGLKGYTKTPLAEGLEDSMGVVLDFE